VMASVVVVLFRPPDFTTNARHHKCLIFSKCSVSPTDFAEEAKIINNPRRIFQKLLTKLFKKKLSLKNRFYV